jgi:glutathione S-transferase
VLLYGYRYSVYAWIARLALHEKEVSYRWREIDPFSPDRPASHLEVHPFGRVPALQHGDFALYETSAMTRYIDEAFPGPSLQPAGARERARCQQIVSIVDSYVYWPLVRQVFSHAVFRRRMGRPADKAAIRRGLEAAPRILGALEALAHGGRHLIGGGFTLADVHLAPMLAYFAEAEDGAALVAGHPKLSAWLTAMREREAFRDTTPEWVPVQPHSD